MKFRSIVFLLFLPLLFQCKNTNKIEASKTDTNTQTTTTSTTTTSTLAVYPKPSKDFSKISPYYEIRVFENESDQVGKVSYVYMSPDNDDTNRIRIDANTRRTFNFSILSFSSPIIVEVTKHQSTATNATIRPSRLGIGSFATTPVGADRKIRFTLSKPSKISIEFNDDPTFKKGLMLFANPAENAADIITEKDSSVFVVTNDNSLSHIPQNTKNVLFAPKVIKIGYWEVPKSVDHIYIPGGAWIRGYFSAKRDNGHPIKINGRGVITGDVYPFHYPDTANKKNDIDNHTWYGALKIAGATGNLVEGLTFTDGSSVYIWLYSQNSTVRNVNFHGFHFNNDGITESGNSVIDNCFFHINEDAIIIYGDNHKITNCTFWQLSNACVQFGWWPHNLGGNNIIDNCDVIHADWVSDDYRNQGFICAMNLTDPSNPGNGLTHKVSTTQNYSVTSIYFDCPILRFIDLRNRSWRQQSHYKNVTQYWNYKNFSFDNIHFKGPQSDTLIVLHSDNDRNISQFVFNQMFMNGKKIEKETYLSSRIFNADALGIIETK